MEENLVSKLKDFSKLSFVSKLEIIPGRKQIWKLCSRHQYERIPHFRTNRTVLQRRVVAPENRHFSFHVFNNNAQKLYIKKVWKPLEVAFKQASYSKHLSWENCLVLFLSLGSFCFKKQKTINQNIQTSIATLQNFMNIYNGKELRNNKMIWLDSKIKLNMSILCLS